MPLKACLQDRVKNLQYLGANFMMDIRIVRPLFWLTEISGADKDYYASKTEDVYDIFNVTMEPNIEG